MKRTYEEWLKYYENATKEQVIEDTMHDMEEITRLNKELGIFQRENDLLKHKLNYIAFGDDSELALRFLRRIGYVDFDEERKVYINKHNNEPFLWKEEQEKDYYLKDEELNEYTQQLEYKVDRLNNIIEENIKVYDETIDLLTTINTEFMYSHTKMTVKSMIIGMEQYLDKLKELKEGNNKN